ncbi:MAG: glycosyltransferase family 61 protein [Actinomycetales bacterium]|nr:glycosyltransferase family 61 protein [Actinomycetales bacterium]
MKKLQSKRDYHRFVRRVIEPIDEFWRDQDPHAFVEAGEALQGAFASADLEEFARNGQVITMRGWLSGSSGYSVDVKALRKRNPDFTVRVHRHIRWELFRGFRFYGIRPGFAIVARSESTSASFLFFVSDASGTPFRLPSSNREARFSRKILDANGNSVQKFRTWPVVGTNIGYVDSVRVTSGVKPRKRTADLWFSSVVHDHPEKLLALVDSPPGAFAASKAADCLSAFPLNARWRDRFELAAHGYQGTFTSDLKPLHVERPYGANEPAQVSDLSLPHLVRRDGVAKAVPGADAIRSPSSEWLTYRDVDVQGGGTVIHGSALICYEAAADPTLDFVSGQWESIFGSREKADGTLVQLSEPRGPKIHEGILMSGRNDENWYHWFIEYLPRVLMIPEGIPKDIPLLVSTRTPQSGLSVLRDLTDRPIVPLDALARTSVGKLHVVAPSTQIMDTTLVAWSEGVSMNPAPLREMRRLIRESVVKSPVPRRIFLVRNSRHRGIQNGGHIMRIAAEHGLELVDPAKLTWHEQRDLFASAELVVGAGGAVMANYLIMPEGSRVIALTSDLLGDFVLPALICAVAGVSFEYVLGRARKTNPRNRKMSSHMHDDFRIDPGHFSAELDRALSALNVTHMPHSTSGIDE